jgi:bacterioferritin (cytochrome b1)
MKTDETVIANLQTTCAVLSHMKEQFTIHKLALCSMDLDWLAHRVHCWHKKASHHERIFIKRLLYYGADPEFVCGSVKKLDDVESVLNDCLSMSASALAQFTSFRKQAWEALADYTTDRYEHVIEDMEKISFKAQRELNLINDLGQPGYVGARLEDGK